MITDTERQRLLNLETDLRRRCYELAEMLNEWFDGGYYATIHPSKDNKWPVFMGQINPERPEDDPVLETMARYLAACEAHDVAYTDEVSNDSEQADALIAATWGPHLEALENWSGPAHTKAGAIAALRFAVESERERYGHEVAGLIGAALGYLESTTERQEPAEERIERHTRELTRALADAHPGTEWEPTLRDNFIVINNIGQWQSRPPAGE